MNRTFKRERREVQTLITSTLLSESRRRFNMEQPPRSHYFHQQIQGGHVEFRQMLSYHMKIFAPNLVQTRNTGQATDSTSKIAFSLSLQCSRQRSDGYNL